VQTLSSADIDDVPVVVRFLLQTVTQADAHMVRISHYECFVFSGSV